MSELINVDGVVRASGERVFGAENRSFRYGDGLFETMRMVDGCLLWAEKHAQRLQKGMKVLQMEGASLFDALFLKQKAEELAKLNKMQRNAIIRLAVYRKGEGAYLPENMGVGYVMQSFALETERYQLNDKGLITNVYTEIKKHADVLANVKSNNGLPYIMASIFKQKNRLDEAFLLNHNGYLCEGTATNVFVQYKGKLFTPALIEGCVAGVMRSKVIELIKKQNLPFEEARIDKRVLVHADEIFVTNAVRGIQWVGGLDEKRFFKNLSVMLSKELNISAELYLASQKVG